MNPIEISPEQFISLGERFLAIASDYLKEMDSRSIPAKERVRDFAFNGAGPGVLDSRG